MTPDDSGANRPDETIISRSALERVLARATELQASSASDTDGAQEGISESRLIEIAREVGLPAEHVRLALAEERSRLPYVEPEHGLLLDALGTATVSAQRAVSGSANDVLNTIDAWMQREEMLEPNRRLPQRRSWSPRRTPLGQLMHALASGGRKLELNRTDEVSATVTSVDAGRAVVRFDADMSALRRTQRTFFVTAGVINLLAFAMISIPLLVISSQQGAGPVGALVPVIGGVQLFVGYSVWRGLRNSYRRTISRVQLRLEQLLDNVEHGAMVARPSLLGQLRDSVLDAVKPVRSINPPRDV